MEATPDPCPVVFFGWEMGTGCQGRVPDTHAVRIAMDANAHDNAKHHSGFTSVEDLILYDAWRRSTSVTSHYEVILHTSDSTHLFFDLERPFTAEEMELPQVELDVLRETIARAFMRHTEAVAGAHTRLKLPGQHVGVPP